jgi:hypothetical protein
MNPGHWSDQDFIDDIYGVGPADRHLEACAACRARHAGMRARKQLLVREPPISQEFLAAQRRSIYRRLQQPSRLVSRLAPAFAVLVLLIGMFVMRQSPPPAPQRDQASDAQLFSDIYALEQSSEPRAAAPVRALFEEN